MELTYSTTPTGYTIYLNGTPWIVQDGYVPFPADTMAHSAELHIQNILDEQKAQENTQTEFEKIVSIVDPFPLKDVYSSKEQVIGAIKNYKYSYEPAIQFIFEGHLQRNLDEDRARIHQSAYLLEKAEAKGLETSVKWQFMDNSVKIITDYNELLTMGLMAAALFQKAISAQEILVAEVSDMEYKESYAYDVKTRFDEVFQQLA